MIVHATNDTVVDMKYIEKANKTYKNSTLKIIEHGTHTFVGNSDKKAIEIVKNFLA